MPVVRAVLGEIARAELVLGGREAAGGDVFGDIQDEPARPGERLLAARRADAGGVRPEVVEGQPLDGQAPGLLGGHLVDCQLEVVRQVIAGKKLPPALVVDNGEAAAVQLVHPVDKAAHLDAVNVQAEGALQGDGHAEIGVVGLPEPGQDLPAVVPVAGFFLRRRVAGGIPVLIIELEQLFERGRRRGDDPEKILGAGMQRRAEAEVPLFLRFEAVDILELVAQRARAVQGYLGIAQGSDILSLRQFYWIVQQGTGLGERRVSLLERVNKLVQCQGGEGVGLESAAGAELGGYLGDGLVVGGLQDVDEIVLPEDNVLGQDFHAHRLDLFVDFFNAGGIGLNRFPAFVGEVGHHNVERHNVLLP